MDSYLEYNTVVIFDPLVSDLEDLNKLQSVKI